MDDSHFGQVSDAKISNDSMIKSGSAGHKIHNPAKTNLNVDRFRSRFKETR